MDSCWSWRLFNVNWIMRKGSLLSFKQGLDQLKSETKEGKEISNSLFQNSPHKSTGEKRIYIYSWGNMCSRHWNGKIYRAK